MRQRSHSPVEVVEDSEPERARPGSASDDEDAPVALRSVQLDLTAPTTSAYFKRSEPAPVASTSTSVPKVFGRRIPPWERLAAAPLPSTSSHARNVSVESCSSSSSSTKRSYSTLITRAEASTTSANGDVPKKVKKVHKAVGTQFQTAAELLSESASGSDHSSPKPKEVILKPSKRVPSKLKNKGKERMIPPPSQKIDALVNSSPSSALDVMMDSSIEVFDLRSNTSESDRAPDSELDLDIPGGSCLGLDRFKYERPTENATSASKRRKNKAILLPSVDPVVLPSRARVRVLDRCPLCDLYFSTSRSAEWKEGHLRTCALTKDYTSETVRVRVEQRILDLAETAEAELRRLDSSRTLFDRTVGKGEGANTHLREVTVVGVEVGEGAEWTREGKEIGKMQKDLEKGMRKPTRDKVIQEAAEIRREGWERERKRGEEAVKVEWGQAQTPRATGVLKPESASSRHAFAGRIEVVLGALGGSGLTQAVTKRRGSESAEDDVFVVDSIAADELMEPPSTQLFAPSALVEKCADTNEIQAVAIPSKLLPKTKRRARRKTSKSDSESDTDEERATRSLWSAAAGHDDEIIQEVVHDRPIHHRRQLEVQLGTPSTTDGSPTRALRSSMTTLGLGVDDDAATSSEGQHSPSRRSLRDEMVIDDDDAKSSSASDVGEGAWEDEIYNDGVMMWDGREEIGTLVVTDDGSSSEDEPLAAVAKRSCAKSTGRKVGRPRKVSTSPSISSPSSTSTSDIDEIVIYSSVNPPPGCPDYSSQSLEQLQRQVKGFGFRVSKEKSVLVDQLIKVWIAMHPPEPPSKSPKVKKPKAAAKKSKSKKKDKEAEAEEEEVDERSLSAKMRESVLANEAIYLKVLRYEPIFFDDIVALAVGNKVKVAKAFLAKWLDDQVGRPTPCLSRFESINSHSLCCAQCITFYTQDPTNGSRRRYK
ncbi:BQ2448_3267 [Microbotryum intermedium]|uniref:Structure-specific endonuclease subunit SLX4 n=1 Tax=Microbotryum intermedium TaxID=269621 RepID=A0A238FFV1_9BASI|nr:BQ2448_3267 [Microbotryum intermedium]